jgi:hypothetical protein
MEWLKRMPSRVDRAIAVTMVGTGVLLPWAVAARVKLHLAALGVPTWPWSTFGALAIPGLLLSVVAAAPLIGLAVFHRAWALGGFLARPPLQRRLVVLSGFAGCAVGMVRVFTDVFREFDPLELVLLPLRVGGYLPHMAAGLLAGALVATIARLVTGTSAGAARRQEDALEAGRAAAVAPPAGPGPAGTQGGAAGGPVDPELAEEAASRARSMRNAGGAAGVVVWMLAAEFAASFEHAFLEDGGILQSLLGVGALVCLVWAEWTVFRGARLLGRSWETGFLVCWLLGAPLLFFGLAVFRRLRRIAAAGPGRPAGHAGPPRVAHA